MCSRCGLKKLRKWAIFFCNLIHFYVIIFLINLSRSDSNSVKTSQVNGMKRTKIKCTQCKNGIILSDHASYIIHTKEIQIPLSPIHKYFYVFFYFLKLDSLWYERMNFYLEFYMYKSSLFCIIITHFFSHYKHVYARFSGHHTVVWSIKSLLVHTNWFVNQHHYNNNIMKAIVQFP